MNALARLRRIGYHVFSLETAFVLFLFAGRYKADPRFAFVPVDVTLLFLVVGLAAAAFILGARRDRLQGASATMIWAGFIFLGYMASSILWSESRSYGLEKATYLVTLSFWALFVPAVIIAPSRERVWRLYGLILAFAGWMMAEAFVFLIRSPSHGFVRVMGGNYLGLGRIIGMGAVVALGLWVADRPRGWAPVWTVALGGFFALLLLSGGRGPLLATLGALAVPLMIGWRPTVRGLRFRRYHRSLF